MDHFIISQFINMKKILLYSFAAFLAQAVQAQSGLSNSGNLKVHSNGSLSISGDFRNNGTANFTNDGSLIIKANIINDQASLNEGTGTLILNGTTLQSVSGTQTMKTRSLVTNNASGFVLNNDLSVGGVHTFTNGIIHTGTNSVAYLPGASQSGANDGKHIKGKVRKFGDTDFTFPVGNGTYLRSASIRNISANAEFEVVYSDATPFTSQLMAPLTSIQSNEYWTINRISGGNARLELNWDNSKVSMPNWMINEIRVAGYDGSNWINRGGTANGDVTTTGIILSDIQSTFNLFTLGTVSSIVPMTLLQFSARKISNNTQVSWRVTNEKNVDRYRIERSDNNNLFYSIEEVKARNQEGVQLYAINDEKIISGNAYYRLRSIDRDGKEKLSQVVMLTAANNEVIKLLNNPVINTLHLLPSNTSGTYHYSIINNNGSVVQQGTQTIYINSRFDIALKHSIASGIYTLVFTRGTENIQIRFMRK